MYKLNFLNYKYNGKYYFQTHFDKSIKIDDIELIDEFTKEKKFTEEKLLQILNKFNYSFGSAEFLKKNNIVIEVSCYRKKVMKILDCLIALIEDTNNNHNINTIFVYSKTYGYRAINIVKAAVELEEEFQIERLYQDDMKIKFNNGYIYDINTKDNIFGENILGCEITRSKSITLHLLSTHDINVPKQKMFYIDRLDRLKEFVDQIKYPICLKPDNMYESKDVFPCVKNDNELNGITEYYKLLYKKFVVEKHIVGNTYRLYYCYGEIIGAIQKGFRFIIGDGLHTIESLIKEKYKLTPLEHYTEECYLTLERMNLGMNEVLEAGEKIHIGNTATDCDFEDFDINLIDPYYNKLAKDVSKAIGLNIFAIDLIAYSLHDIKDIIPTVLEIQEGPEFGRGNLNVNTYYRKILKELSYSR